MDIKFFQDGPDARNAKIELNGQSILVTECTLHIEASVKNPVTKITLKGIVNHAEIVLTDLKTKNIEIDGVFYVAKTTEEIMENIE